MSTTVDDQTTRESLELGYRPKDSLGGQWSCIFV